MLRQLRQSRYLALGALMIVVAAICVGAGTWQIERFLQKHDANHLLRGNAERSAADVQDVLVPTSASNAHKQADKSQFRHVVASGQYDSADQLLVREQTVNGTVGYLVLTPLRTDSAVLLVVRGFVAADGTHTPTVAAAPGGTVSVTGRVQPGTTGDDKFGHDPSGQVSAIDTGRIGTRLAVSTYSGYVELLANQPGTAGLTTIPDPDLSNPAGGAIEPQHMAYIIQWYLFALLALAAPVVMARADMKRAEERDDQAPDEPTGRDAFEAFDDSRRPGAEPTDAQLARAAKMADRYSAGRRR